MLKVVFLLFTLLLTSCRMPGLVGPMSPVRGIQAPAGQVVAQPLSGTVEWPAERGVQAAIADVASASVVSIIDAATGVSVGASVSDASGGFAIRFGPLFRPTVNQAFIAEAVKGLRSPGAGPDGQFNQAGAEAVRLRTIVYYDGGSGGWKGLTSGTPGTVHIGQKTTALSVGIALRQAAGLPLVLTDYINAIPGNGTYVPPSGGIDTPEFDSLTTLVGDALAQDRDPVHYVSLDTSSGRFASTFVGFAITDVQPRTGTIETPLTITGTGFDTGTITVAINGVPATITSFTADTIQAKVGPGSRTGPVTVTVGGALQAGPTFTVNVSDGHNVFLNGSMYVVNPAWGTLSRIDAAGYVKTVGNGINSPQQVAVGPDGLVYVSGQGDNKVWRFDPASGFASSSFAVVTAPNGLAFDTSGNLFVSSNQGAGNVYKLNAGGTVVNTYPGFTNPQSLALDYAGKLIVVEAGGAVTKITPDDPAGNPRTPLAFLPTPSGLAVDSAGNAFVTCTSSNCISRVDPLGNTSVFAVVTSPGGIAFDSSGALFTSDTTNNLIYRISPSGNLSTFAYGISTPRGLAVNPSTGVVYVSLYNSNAILQVNPADGVLKPLVKGIAPPLTLTYRDGGLFIAHPDTNAVSFADPSGQMTTVGTNLTQPSGADKDPVSGKVYVGRYGIPWFSWAYTSGWTDGGYHVLDGGSVTTAYPNQRKDSAGLTVDGNGVVFSVSSSGRQLSMSTPIGPGSYQTRLLHTFATNPNKLALDAANNLYASVGSEHKVYRFRVAANYAKEEITGFSNPYGLAFDGSGTLWVSNMSDGKLRKVTNPELATTVTADAWLSAVVGTGVRGLAVSGGDLFMANGTNLDWYTMAAGTSSNFVSGLAGSISDIWGRPGEIYAQSGSTIFKIDQASRVASYFLSGDGRLIRIAFDPAGKLYRAFSSSGNIISTATSPQVNLVRLGYTHEMGLDGDQLYFTTTYNTDGVSGCAGIYRFDLTSGQQYQYPLGVTWSLAVASDHTIYVGTNANKVVELNTTTGATTDRFSLGTRPYGLDIYEGASPATLWAVGADGRVFEMQVGGSMTIHYFGLMQPRF